MSQIVMALQGEMSLEELSDAAQAGHGGASSSGLGSDDYESGSGGWRCPARGTAPTTPAPSRSGPLVADQQRQPRQPG